MVRSSFIPFPEKEVKIGDTYEAGEIAKAIAKLEGGEFNLPRFLWRGVLN